jgi:hypothetical protein
VYPIFSERIGSNVGGTRSIYLNLENLSIPEVLSHLTKQSKQIEILIDIQFAELHDLPLREAPIKK